MRSSQRTSALGLALLLALSLVPVGGQALSQTNPAQINLALDDALDHAEAAQNSGRYPEAAAAYQKATRLAPHMAELWANKGLMEHLSNQPKAAIASFHQALALKRGLFTATLFTGIDLVALGNPEQALPFLRSALTAQPGNAEAALAMAQAYAALHQLRPATQAYEAATAANPNSSVAWYGLAVSALNLIEADGGTLARNHSDSVWARMLYADELLAQDRLREATDLYRDAARDATPTQRAEFLRVLDGPAQAGPAQRPFAHQISATTLERLRQVLRPVSPPDLCAGPGSAACAFFGGDFNRSAELASDVLAKDPAHVEALYWSVKANEHRAVRAFSRFQSLAPQSPATFDLSGDLYRRRDLPEQARTEYAKALAADPHDPAALLGTAAAHLSEGHVDEALVAARLGLTDRPDDPRLNLMVGEALIAQHHFPEARPYLQRSLRGEAIADAHVHALLGRILAEEGRTEVAIREMRLGLPSDRDGSLHFQLYRLLRKTGDLAGAQQAEAGARNLQAQRLQHAATAVQETHPSQK